MGTEWEIGSPNKRIIPRSAQPTSPTQVISFSRSGTLAVRVGPPTPIFRFPFGAWIISVRATVGVAPTGSAINLDLNMNGTSILPSVLSIPAGTKVSAVVPIGLTALPTDELTVDIDQVGSTAAGEFLTVSVYYRGG